MQDKLEVHTNENSVNHYVEITTLIGPRRQDLPPEGGFYVRPGSGRMILVRPEQRSVLVLRKGMYLSPSEFRKRHEFIVETRAELNSQRTKTVKIEVDKPRDKTIKPKMFDIDDLFISNKIKTTMPCMKKQRKENTGIQVAISDDPYPIVTHIQALTREELPSKYLKGYLPKVWLERDKLFSEPNHVLLEKNKERPYSQQEIAAALLHIRLAGEHLAAVNKPKELYPNCCQAATFKDGRLT